MEICSVKSVSFFVVSHQSLLAIVPGTVSIPFYVLFFDFRPTEKGLGSLNLTVICTVSSTVALYWRSSPYI